MDVRTTAYDRKNGTETARVTTHGGVETVLLGARRLFGRKWQPVIVYHLLDGGAMRFSELKAAIDEISGKMLSESLTELEESGVVERCVTSQRPVRVEYTLTTRGQSLEPVLRELIRWGTEHLDED